MSVTRGKEWSARMSQAVACVRDARAAIEALSELAESEVDMKLCFAGNCLEGSAALLREADQEFGK